MNLTNDINKLQDIFENVKKFEIDLSKPVMASLDFKICKQNLYIQEWKTQLDRIRKNLNTLSTDEIQDSSKQKMNLIIENLYEGKNINSNIINELSDLSKSIKYIEKKETIKIPLSIPTEIYSEIEMDVNELNKCYTSACYRSCVIICGRIMEVALHRKYFEVTGNDLLEKSPGIGLGNLIAKMKDRNIEFDPGITQQIHLVNQVRIFSVHKKQQPFYPTKQQTYAMILYTMDIIGKIF